MKILFDLSAAQPFSSNDFHGGSEYAKTVFYRLCELLPPESSLEVFYNPLKNMDNSILEICKKNGYTVNLCRNNSDINKLLSVKSYAVFFSALPYVYFDLVVPPQTKFIYIIHGLRSLEYMADKYMLHYIRGLKQTLKFMYFFIFPFITKKMYLKRAVKRLNRLFSVTENQTIITVSNHSKHAIAYFFPYLNANVNESPVKVFYSPAKNYYFDITKSAQILGSFSLEPEKYILLICADRTEKGAYRACRVLHRLIAVQKRIPGDIKVIVTGVTYYKSYRYLVKNNSRFIFKGYVSVEELECLYKNAHLFLYPTLNEGFGYPPLEAMKYGTFCACSANSAVTEICADAVLYFNPQDETEMSIRILQSFDEETRREKAGKAIERCKVVGKKQEQDLDLLVNEIIN
jgi:hypothetical protein